MVREILLSGEKLTAPQIIDIIKNKYPEEWESKERYYLDGGKDEEYVYRQVRAEITSLLGVHKNGWTAKNRCTRNKDENGEWVYLITDEYRNFLTNNTVSEFLDETDDIENVDELVYDVDRQIEEECEDCPKEYFVYLMKSDEFDNTYKIGFTDNIERRPKELRSPSNKVYNIFNFYVLNWVKVTSKKEMELMEDTLHTYFHRDRKYRKNGGTVDTEIFVNPNMKSLFRNFILKNYITDDYNKTLIVDHNFDN